MVSAAVAAMGTAGQQTAYGTGALSSGNKTSVDFSKVMSESLSAGANKMSYSDSKAVTQVSEPAASKTDRQQGVEQSKKTESSDTKKAEQSADKNTDKAEVTEKLEDVAEDVKDKIKDTFGVTDEQLEEAMASLGIGLLDLLQPEQLTQLVAAVNGQEDALSILLNENLSSGLQDLLKFVSEQTTQLADSMNISLEELQQMIAAADNRTVMEDGQPEQNMLQQNVVTDADVKDAAAGEAQNGNEAQDALTDAIESKLVTDESSETGNKDSSFSDSRQNARTDAVTAQHSEASNLAQSIANSFTDALVNAEQGINAADIVRQVVNEVKITQLQQLQRIEVALNPENLGKVVMSVTAKNGIVTAQLIAENEQVKQALESQMVTLRERFDNQGIKVDAVEVTVQSHSFEANENLKGNDSEEQKESKKTSGRLRMDSLDDLDEGELSDEELRARDLINNGISSVEYSA